MPSVNLTFNILPFDLNSNLVSFYFSQDESERGHRIHKKLFPKNIKDLYPDLSDDQEYLYTTFTEPASGFAPLKINTSQIPFSLLKRYYNYLMFTYFKENGLVIERNFVNDVEVRILEKETSTFQIFNKFTLRVQFMKVSGAGELLIAYNGKSKLLKQSVADLLENVSPAVITKILYTGNMYNYQKLTPEEFNTVELSEAFPFVNLKLARALNWEIEAPDTKNKYLKFKSLIEAFRATHLDNDIFKSLIPLSATGFLKVSEMLIGNVREESNKLVFGSNLTGIVPFLGLKRSGPNSKCQQANIHIFFICHENDNDLANQLALSFKKGIGAFPGLTNLVKVPYHIRKEETITFADSENPFPEIQRKLIEWNNDPDIQYFAIYLSPFDKYEEDKEKSKIYYKLKHILLNKNIHSQVIVKEKVGTGDKFKNYGYSLNNIAIAALAKLGGIPWRIQTPRKKELVVGVGAFQNTEIGVRYIGSAFSFQNNGQFNEFECFVGDNTQILAGSIHNAIIKFTSVNTAPERLIIHFYKTMSNKEIAPILAKLENLGLKIPVFVITINKTESKDIIAWDNDWNNLMPQSGTYVKIAWNNYLLFNNTRYSAEAYNGSEGFPFPVKLKLSCTNEELLTGNTVRDLIDQVYQFSRMYWKSVRQQHLPVTIKYPEMVAEIYPHFESYALPDFGKDKLWFL